MGADYSSAFGGAFSFSVDAVPVEAWTPWDVGSAFIYIMLIAGAGAYDTSVRGGASAFDMNTRPSDAWWSGGSAY